MPKKNLVIFFGGRSVEHDVSLITGWQAVKNANPQKYNIIPIYLSQKGEFCFLNPSSDQKKFFQEISRYQKQGLIDYSTREIIFKKTSPLSLNKKIKIDVAFPAFHGTLGEDGSFQGLLEMAGIPYVGSGVLASAIGMNKDFFKKIMSFYQIPILPWQTVTQESFTDNFQPRFNYPLIAKPVNLGSSIGVKKVNNRQELKNALEVIFNLDCEAMLEPYLEKMSEINCSVLGSKIKQEASVCEQPIPAKDILSFEDKYLKGGKKTKAQGMAGLDRKIPAPISKEQTNLIQNLAKKVFQVCECSGVARIDFMIDNKTQKIFVNEINTLPGSLSFYLWQASGMSFQELIDKLVEIAYQEREEKNHLQRTFTSSIIKHFTKN